MHLMAGILTIHIQIMRNCCINETNSYVIIKFKYITY